MPLILWISTIFGENDNSEIYRSECKYGEIGGEREKDTLNDEILIPYIWSPDTWNRKYEEHRNIPLTNSRISKEEEESWLIIILIRTLFKRSKKKIQSLQQESSRHQNLSTRHEIANLSTREEDGKARCGDLSPRDYRELCSKSDSSALSSLSPLPSIVLFHLASPSLARYRFSSF